MKRMGKLVILVALASLAACGQQPTEDETPLSAEEKNWQQYGVDDPRSLEWMNMRLNTRMETDQGPGKAVERLDRVRDAAVIRTDHNAYVAVRTSPPYGSGGTELSNAMKSRIILAVKTVDSKISNVYVSVKPEFYTSVRKYAAKLNHGVSERQLVQSFNTRMQQFFP